jgi:hypothetical protein
MIRGPVQTREVNQSINQSTISGELLPFRPSTPVLYNKQAGLYDTAARNADANRLLGTAPSLFYVVINFCTRRSIQRRHVVARSPASLGRAIHQTCTSSCLALPGRSDYLVALLR